MRPVSLPSGSLHRAGCVTLGLPKADTKSPRTVRFQRFIRSVKDGGSGEAQRASGQGAGLTSAEEGARRTEEEASQPTAQF